MFRGNTPAVEGYRGEGWFIETIGPGDGKYGENSERTIRVPGLNPSGPPTPGTGIYL